MTHTDGRSLLLYRIYWVSQNVKRFCLQSFNKALLFWDTLYFLKRWTFIKLALDQNPAGAPEERWGSRRVRREDCSEAEPQDRLYHNRPGHWEDEDTECQRWGRSDLWTICQSLRKQTLMWRWICISICFWTLVSIHVICFPTKLKSILFSFDWV